MIKNHKNLNNGIGIVVIPGVFRRALETMPLPLSKFVIGDENRKPYLERTSDLATLEGRQVLDRIGNSYPTFTKTRDIKGALGVIAEDFLNQAPNGTELMVLCYQEGYQDPAPTLADTIQVRYFAEIKRA